MRFTQIILILSILIVNQGCEPTPPAMTTGFSLHGFKSVKFDITPDQVSDLGYACESNKSHIYCKKPSYIKDPETLFGKSVYVTVEFIDGKMYEIQLWTENLSHLELIDLYTESLGEPKVRDFFDPRHGTVRHFIWISDQQTSVDVPKRLGKPSNSGMAFYRGAEETLKLLEKTTDPNVYRKDLKDF